MPTNPLETRWGGNAPSHGAIILDPANAPAVSDLVLTSEVLVQSFFNFSRHEYLYRALNRSDASGAHSAMRVEWHGPKVTWHPLAPGGPAASRMQSFFSPQRTKTTADADVLAGNVPVRAATSSD